MSVKLWDTPGEKRTINITSSYLTSTKGIILVYDITNRESFENLTFWIEEIMKKCLENACKILVGNKCDMENERQVLYEEGKDFGEQYNMKFFETSAKNINSINNAFIHISKEVLKYNMKKPDTSNQIPIPVSYQKKKSTNFFDIFRCCS